jgi:hypothetical protein
MTASGERKKRLVTKWNLERGPGESQCSPALTDLSPDLHYLPDEYLPYRPNPPARPPVLQDV